MQKYIVKTIYDQWDKGNKKKKNKAKWDNKDNKIRQKHREILKAIFIHLYDYI